MHIGTDIEHRRGGHVRGSSPWIQIFKRVENASMRLICFPFAGGGAQIFRQWPEQLPADLELCAVQLPGREMRLRETPFSDVHALIDAMTPALLPLLDKPFALFGHSMGALVAFECARRLEQKHNLTPECLIASARVAPQSPLSRAPINALPQAEFIEGLRKLNGTSGEILDNREMMANLGPLLRADLAIHEEYIYRPAPRLRCDILALGGLRDPEAGRDGLNGWQQHTNGAFALRMVPGDHFFIQSAQTLFLRMLSLELYQYIGRQPVTQPPTACAAVLS
jgi:surfactin synthase thioesterase subunit